MTLPIKLPPPFGPKGGRAAKAENNVSRCALKRRVDQKRALRSRDQHVVSPSRSKPQESFAVAPCQPSSNSARMSTRARALPAPVDLIRQAQKTERQRNGIDAKVEGRAAAETGIEEPALWIIGADMGKIGLDMRDRADASTVDMLPRRPDGGQEAAPHGFHGKHVPCLACRLDLVRACWVERERLLDQAGFAAAIACMACSTCMALGVAI